MMFLLLLFVFCLTDTYILDFVFFLSYFSPLYSFYFFYGVCFFFLFFFFFKQKTAYEMRISDWSSDVCSSDLQRPARGHIKRAMLDIAGTRGRPFVKMHGLGNDFVVLDARTVALELSDAQVRAIADRRTGVGCDQLRSEERRVGTECVSTCRSRWSRSH